MKLTTAKPVITLKARGTATLVINKVIRITCASLERAYQVLSELLRVGTWDASKGLFDKLSVAIINADVTEAGEYVYAASVRNLVKVVDCLLWGELPKCRKSLSVASHYILN